MDPDTTLRELVQAVAAGDIDRAKETAENLRRWMLRGGFPPQTIGPESLGREWHAALTRCVCQLAELHVWQMRTQQERRQQGDQDFCA